MNSLAAIVADFARLQETGREWVMATIIETKGSTYQKAGARMLISRDGELFGLLGGGCFEPDLTERAREVFDTRRPKIVYYDLRGPEEAVWGLGLGCEGAVTIFLQHLSADNDFQPLPAVKDCLDALRTDMLITVTESEIDNINTGLTFLASQLPEQKLPAEFIDEVEATASAFMHENTSRAVQHLVADGTVNVFYSPVRPPLQLLIIGAGPDAVPVVKLAATLGWQVTVVDYRESYVKAERFPGACRVLQILPEELDAKLTLDAFAAAVLMTHRFEYDERYLRRLSSTQVSYIGLLGPVARRDLLLEALGPDADGIAGRVYGPVGLNLGGRLPEEIALSLIAQIQAVVHGRSGGHLVETPALKIAANMEELHVLILAAGGSTRFGALKQLLEFESESLLRRTVRTANDLVDDRVIVVHGPKAKKCQREIESLPVTHVVNDNWESGMSTSIRAGLRALPPECGAVLILLCDQPLIRTTQLQKLTAAWLKNKNRIIASAYSDTIGVPAIFPVEYIPELLKVTGDQGAKSVIEAHRETVLSVELPEAGTDIDTQEDYSAVLMRD